jgi:hypothetical protein
MTGTEHVTKTNTPPFRVAYPNLFTPRKNDLNGKDEYSLVALFPAGADLTVLKQAAGAAIRKKWGEDKSKWPSGLRSPFRDQGEKKKKNDAGQMALPDGYVEGATFLTLRTTQRPGVVDQQVQEIIDTAEFYGGCWAIASINAFAYDAKGNKGVSFGLGNVQKHKDDKPFGNRTKPQDDFQAIAGSTEDVASPAGDLFN